MLALPSGPPYSHKAGVEELQSRHEHQFQAVLARMETQPDPPLPQFQEMCFPQNPELYGGNAYCLDDFYNLYGHEDYWDRWQEALSADAHVLALGPWLRGCIIGMGLRCSVKTDEVHLQESPSLLRPSGLCSWKMGAVRHPRSTSEMPWAGWML